MHESLSGAGPPHDRGHTAARPAHLGCGRDKNAAAQEGTMKVIEILVEDHRHISELLTLLGTGAARMEAKV